MPEVQPDHYLIPVQHDWYHLRFCLVIRYNRENEEDDESAVFGSFNVEARVDEEPGWVIEEEWAFSFAPRADIREWFETNIGPYSPQGEYGVTKTDAQNFAFFFKNHRHAVAFKMTWL